MPPAPSATWIQLSDLHRGARGERRDWPVVRDALGRDLDRMQRLVGPPDLVLFTGDLACSGLGDQYAEVEVLLDWLDHRLGRKLPVFAVPGNHDLARPSSPRGFSWLFSQDPPARRAREDALCTDSSDIASLFADWAAFSSRRLGPRLPGLAHGLLPGDQRWSVQAGGLRLGLLGLNSAWRQYSGDDFRGRVEVSPHQLHALLPDGADAFRDQHHLVLLLQHHPPEWMADRAQWRSHVATAAHAVLVGHMHDNQAEVHRAESNEDLAVAQARSLCGLEHYGTDQEDRRFGYRWFQARVIDGGADGPVTRLRTWSRTLVEGARWRFVHPQCAEYDEREGMKLADVPVAPALGPVPTTAMASSMPDTIDIFVAHASADKVAAEALHAAVKARGLTPFVDSLDLGASDDWNRLLPQALARSRIAVVLVSDHYDAAWYLRDEVSTAIALARDPTVGQRIVPVFLQGFPASAGGMPYGLRNVQGLDWRALGGADGVAKVLAGMPAATTASPLPAPLAAPPTELTGPRRYDVLSKLLRPALERVLYRAGVPAVDMPTQPHSLRALSVVQWLDVQTSATRRAFDDLLRAEAPGLFE